MFTVNVSLPRFKVTKTMWLLDLFGETNLMYSIFCPLSPVDKPLVNPTRSLCCIKVCDVVPSGNGGGLTSGSKAPKHVTPGCPNLFFTLKRRAVSGGGSELTAIICEGSTLNLCGAYGQVKVYPITLSGACTSVGAETCTITYFLHTRSYGLASG